MTDNMKVVYGLLMVAAGLFMAICGRSRSNFVVYRMMVARSRGLWGEQVYRFHQVAGTIVIVFGVLVALGYI